MAVGTTTVQVIYGVAMVTSGLLSYILWKHRHKTGALPLFVAIVAGMWWSAALFLATVVSDYGLSVLFERSLYPGVVVAVAAFFVFGLEYTGREHLVTRRLLALLSIEPIVAVVLAYTNPGNVFFESVGPDPTAATGVALEFGVGFQLHSLYSYALVLGVGLLVLELVYRTKSLYRGQLVVLLAAVVVPPFANVVWILGFVEFDTTPVGFLGANALYTVAITRYRLIDLVPIARDRVVSNVNDAMFVVDLDHRLVDVNPAGADLAEEFVGEADLIGENARELLEFVPEIAELYDEIVAEEKERSVEYEIGGGHYLAEATPIRDTQDRVVGWLFLIRDITERKRREQEFRERNEKLDTFASVVSHDLRNPLQVASGRIELARQTGETEHLESVEEALERMETIIDDVLSLARGGDPVTNQMPVPIEDLTRTAWATVTTDGAELRVTTDGRITADRDRLVRLLENLFRNAVEHGMEVDVEASGVVADAGDGEGPRIREVADSAGDDTRSTGGGDVTEPPLTVEVGVVSEDGEAVGLYVADDGPGIPPDEREAVFESGFSTNEDGTGFGLTIVSQIAEAHGWTVRVTESETGGARFEFTGAEVVGV